MKTKYLTSIFIITGLLCSPPSQEDTVPRPDYDAAAVEAILALSDDLESGKSLSVDEGKVAFDVARDGSIKMMPVRGDSIDKSSRKTPNGCSTPWIAKALYAKLKYYEPMFTPACNTHDFCYKLGQSTYQYSRTKCDAGFLYEMIRVCHERSERFHMPRQWKEACDKTGRIMYNAVRAAGDSSYVLLDRRCPYETKPKECSFKWDD